MPDIFDQVAARDVFDVAAEAQPASKPAAPEILQGGGSAAFGGKLPGPPKMTSPVHPVSRIAPVLDAAAPAVDKAKQAVTGHAISSLGGATATDLYEMAGESAKTIAEKATGQPWERIRQTAPAPAKIAEFAYGAGKAVPGLIDFAMTPMGAASLAVLPTVPPPVKAAAESYFGTEMAVGAKDAIQHAAQQPTPANVGEAVGATAMTALPLVHARAANKKAAAAERELADYQRARELNPPPVEPPVEVRPPKPAPPPMNREQRRATVAPPEIGPPEQVVRAQAAREDIIGKPREEWTNADVLAADALIREGNVGAPRVAEPMRTETPAPPQLETPGKPAPKRAPISEIAEKVLAEEPKPQPESKPYSLTPEEQAALRSQNAPEIRTESLPERPAAAGAGEPAVAPKAEPVRAEAERAAVEPVAEVAPLPPSLQPKEVIPEKPVATGAVNGKPSLLNATPEEVAAARARIKSRIAELATSEEGTQRFQLDPRDIEDLVIIGSDYVKTAGRSLEKWSDAMVAEFGDVVKPYLLSIYTKSVRRTIEAPPEPPPLTTPGQPRPKPAQATRDRLTAPGLSLVEGGKQTVNGPKVVQFPAGKSGERGSFSLKPTGPQTPSEVYAKEQVAKREAARKGPMRDMVDRLKIAVAKAKSEGVDAVSAILDPIHKAQKEHGYELRPSENIEHQIDRVYRSRSIADQFMQDNKLLDVIRNVDDIDYFDQYLIAKQALDVEAHGFKTGRDLVRDGQLVRDFQKRYADAEKVIREYDQKLLDYSVDAGLISRELADHLQQIYKDYVPLNRVFNALEKTDLGQVSRARGVASLSKQTVVEKLMGSEREIESPFASFIDKTYRAFSQGERNKAARMLAGYKDLPGMEGLIREAAPSESIPQDRSFNVIQDGVKRTYETTREIAAAAKSLDVRDIGLLGQIFAVPARLMKTGTTGINLPFVASNVAVDQTFTLITSRYDRSLANPITFVRALSEALKHGDLWNEMMREGGGFTSFDISRNQPKKTIDRIRAGRDTEARLRYVVEHPISSVAELLRATEDAVSRSEQFGRMRLYASAKEAALKAGHTEADARILAANHANNALPNYLRSGSVMRPLNAAIPYLNAGVQGSRAFLRAMAEDPVRASAAVATTLFFPVAMATLWNLSDPERKRAYTDIQDYEKENNLVILAPWGGKPSQDKQGRYEVIKIKLPPGLSNLASPVRRFLEQAEGLDPVKFREMFDAAVGTVSPIEPNMRGLSTVIPQGLKPSIQAAANYDFFRQRPKVPRRLQDQPANMQVQPYTSGTARKVAGALGASPIKTEEFIKDTLGGIGSQILNVSDRALSAAGVIPKDQIGGTSTAEAVTARFNTARGGELENREYAKRKEVEDAAISKAVERAKQTPFYSRLATEELRQRHLQTVANRARYEVSKVTQTPRYKRLQPEQKMAELEKAGARIARSGVSGRITRPSPPPLRSPRPFEARN
jgi:hypothetical protein